VRETLFGGTEFAGRRGIKVEIARRGNVERGRPDWLRKTSEVEGGGRHVAGPRCLRFTF